MLTANFCRRIPYALKDHGERVVLYSDAEDNGGMAAVAIRGNTKLFMRGQIPRSIRTKLKRRKTNIVAYELIIAVAAMAPFCPEVLEGADIYHYVDSQPAISCILKGSSPQEDLNHIAARLWFECRHRMANYFVRFVQPKLNLADAPSRSDTSSLMSLGFVNVPFNLPAFKG